MSTDWGYTTADGETTGGWSGSDASHDRASGEERKGIAGKRRQQVWDIVRISGLQGATWYEVAATLRIHHGAASGALSNLHKAGRLERLKERRGGSSIYVLPHAVNGRETAPFGRTRAAKPLVEVLGQPDPQDAQEALSRAEEQGWQRGYDEGMAIGLSQPNPEQERALRAAYDEGVEIGARRERDKMARYLSALLVEYRRLTPQVLGGHHAKCWLIHPQCAVQNMLKAVSS